MYMLLVVNKEICGYYLKQGLEILSGMNDGWLTSQLHYFS